VGASDNNIYILSLKDLSCIHTLSGHKNSVFTVCYHPTDNYLLSGGRDAHLKIWSTDGYHQTEDIVAHLYAINNVQFSADGKYFASCSMDKSIKIWDAESFRLLKVIDKARHAGHGTSINKLLWLAFNNLLLSVSDDRSVAVWDIQIDNS
jgi:WD40 repeat protein